MNTSKIILALYILTALIASVVFGLVAYIYERRRRDYFERREHISETELLESFRHPELVDFEKARFLLGLIATSVNIKVGLLRASDSLSSDLSIKSNYLNNDDINLWQEYVLARISVTDVPLFRQLTKEPSATIESLVAGLCARYQ